MSAFRLALDNKIVKDAAVALLEEFRERCAEECDQEEASAEHRGAAREAKVAKWCAKHIREIDVAEWATTERTK